ncbi:MAG: UDP-N-acetylmuramoyl-L-alanine--D-glutamate ligase [Myxococcota bacterium]
MENSQSDLPEMQGWKVLVIGLGLSGVSASRFCAERGASVVAVDERPQESLPHLDPLSLTGDIDVRTGTTIPDSSGFDLVVPSPGVPRQRFAEGAQRIWGDIELTARALSVPLVAVTGTNGKSTVVRLIESMLRAAGVRARAAGNIGTPALSLVAEPLDIAVLEVSSFQLETVESFRPKVAIFLNVTPDHLDRHGSFDDYVRAKSTVFARQEADDVAVLNFDDPVVRELASSLRARVVFFSRRSPQTDGVTWDAGRILLPGQDGPRDIALDPTSLPGLQGVHNLENVLAATAAVCSLGADPNRAAEALLDFEGLPHRCQQVASGGGVRFVDDSKATNAGAAQRSLESFPNRVLWIAGGRGKGTDLAALANTAVARARHAFLIGEASDALEAALAGRLSTTRCRSIEDAVASAAEIAEPGEVVLLAPACASFDQFASFEERGDRFAAAARSWTASRSGGQ